eukprot:TRINITY_DN2446_c0_g2_i1.p1 TRINITY_DN2446_c0_g2~~TRINITY_DN2446_c0_g2_i1.p1  ORF type:complete len:437 (-),score=90.49 TRINITY_DN2446_c0_g2_i1:106-1377(-)
MQQRRYAARPPNEGYAQPYAAYSVAADPCYGSWRGYAGAWGAGGGGAAPWGQNESAWYSEVAWGTSNLAGANSAEKYWQSRSNAWGDVAQPGRKGDAASPGGKEVEEEEKDGEQDSHSDSDGEHAGDPSLPEASSASASAVLAAAASAAAEGTSTARKRQSRKAVARLWCQILLHKNHPDFDLIPMLIGRRGCNMRDIHSATNAKVRIRGRGSGYFEVDGKREAPVPLMVVVTAEKTDAVGFVEAVKMTMERLRHVEERCKVFCKQRNCSMFYKIFSLGEVSPESEALLGEDIINSFPGRQRFRPSEAGPVDEVSVAGTDSPATNATAARRRRPRGGRRRQKGADDDDDADEVEEEGLVPAFPGRVHPANAAAAAAALQSWAQGYQHCGAGQITGPPGLDPRHAASRALAAMTPGGVGPSARA